MELKDYLVALRRRWFLVVLCAMLGVVLGGTVTLVTPRVYEARSELFVAPREGTTSSELVQGSSFVLSRVQSYARVISSEVVLGPVIEELGLEKTVPELADQVTSKVVPDTVIVVIAARADSADEAARVAGAVATKFVEVAPTLEPQRADETGVIEITLINSARPQGSPVSPQPVLNLALGLLLGLAFGVSAAVIRQAADRRVHTEDDVRRLTDAPIMGHVPLDAASAASPLVFGRGSSSSRAESLRQLRTNLQFLDLPQNRRSYVVTSSLPGEGKTVTALNLALTLAESGNRVCYVEADLRRPTAADYLHLVDSVGLTHVLTGAAEVKDVTQRFASTLDVVLAGAVPPNPADLLAGNAMHDLVQELESAYDVVILDTPPLLPVTDAAILAKRCSGAILVVALGRRAVSRVDLDDSLGILSTVGARLLGVVLNKIERDVSNGRSRAYATYESLVQGETKNT